MTTSGRSMSSWACSPSTRAARPKRSPRLGSPRRRCGNSCRRCSARQTRRQTRRPHAAVGPQRPALCRSCRGSSRRWNGPLGERPVPRPISFRDAGGVITDPARRTAEWQRLAGGVFASRLGGSAAAWGEAHRVVTTCLFARDQARKRATPDFLRFYRTYQVAWIGEICARVGLPTPYETVCINLAERATAAITTPMHAAVPGAAEAIRTLHRAGYTLHTASGAASEQLAGCLDGMDVRGCFGRLYGADLINTFKEGSEYYPRLFADVATPPLTPLLVDDSPDALAWPAHVGA